MLTSTCTVYADDHLFYAMSSDLEIVKKINVPSFSNVWCSTLLCTKEIQVGKLPQIFKQTKLITKSTYLNHLSPPIKTRKINLFL